MRSRRCRASLIAVAIAWPWYAAAQALASVHFEIPAGAAPNVVDVLVHFRAPNESNAVCGALVSFGDGKSREIRVGDSGSPHRVRHAYEAEGIYTVTVQAKMVVQGLQSALPCPWKTTRAAVASRASGMRDSSAVPPPSGR